MIIKEDNELRFVLESKEGFIFENDEKALAAIEVDDGKKAYVSVEKYKEQYRVEIHPRFVIPGKAAFSAYEALATSDDGLFGMYINPSGWLLSHGVPSKADCSTYVSLFVIVTDERLEQFANAYPDTFFTLAGMIIDVSPVQP